MKRNLLSMTFRLMAFAFLGLLLIGIAGCGESGSPSSDTNDPIDDGSAATAASISLSASSNGVPTDGASSVDITAHVIDSNRAAIEGKRVSFFTTGGQISSASADTDTDGRATIKFSSGPDKNNQTVVITGIADGKEAPIPISIYGTKLTLSPTSAQISTGGSRQVTIKAEDANEKPIANASLQVSLVSGPAGLSFSPSISSPIVTNTSGLAIFTITAGNTAGEAILRAEGLGVSSTVTYQVGASESIFRITEPAQEYLSAPADGGGVNIRVQSGGMSAGETVVLSSSFGQWSDGSTGSVERVLAADGGEIAEQLSSTDAGVASVQAYSKANISLSDTTRILFFNPASKAYAITVEASEQNLPPSTGGTEYSVIVTAKVSAIGGAPVGDAIVNFSLRNTTGGGEYLTPVSVKTNDYGEAVTSFTTGTIGTGSETGDAVVIRAEVATPERLDRDTVFSEVPIIIHGAAANINVGFASEIQSNENSTLYLLPVSILVADTNGNPVTGKTVSLSLRPSRFQTGYWVKADEWIVVYGNPCLGAVEGAPYEFVNEDLNGNAYLDDGEDEVNGYPPPNLLPYFTGYAVGDLVPGLNDGDLTPGQSSTGTIPALVETDENGVANFVLTYQKEYAVWTEAQITASTTVFGTENITRTRKWLPIAANEKEIIAQAFPESPYNILPCDTVNY